MDKPIKRSIEAYDYNEVIDYIEKKYNINTRKLSLSFWHWLIDEIFYGISNGCYQYLYIKEIMNKLDEDDWQHEILKMIYDEFQEDEMYFWIEW